MYFPEDCKQTIKYSNGLNNYIDFLTNIVEDPSDGFIALRDMLDCQSCQTLPAFHPPLIHQPFTEATAKLAREKFKINKVGCT